MHGLVSLLNGAHDDWLKRDDEDDICLLDGGAKAMDTHRTSLHLPAVLLDVHRKYCHLPAYLNKC